MQLNQQLNRTKFFIKASTKQRMVAGFVFLGIVALWLVLYLASEGKIDLVFWVGACGFKERYGLPCPTCGMTTAAVAFSRGKILESFWVQPAGALLCSIAAVSGFLALFTTVFGVYCSFLKLLAEIRAGCIVWALLIIIFVGWVFTFIRALVTNG